MPYPYPPTEEKPPLEEPKEAEVSPLFQALLKEEEKEKEQEVDYGPVHEPKEPQEPQEVQKKDAPPPTLLEALQAEEDKEKAEADKIEAAKKAEADKIEAAKVETEKREASEFAVEDAKNRQEVLQGLDQIKPTKALPPGVNIMPPGFRQRKEFERAHLNLITAAKMYYWADSDKERRAALSDFGKAFIHVQSDPGLERQRQMAMREPEELGKLYSGAETERAMKGINKSFAKWLTTGDATDDWLTEFNKNYPDANAKSREDADDWVDLLAERGEEDIAELTKKQTKKISRLETAESIVGVGDVASHLKDLGEYTQGALMELSTLPAVVRGEAEFGEHLKRPFLTGDPIFRRDLPSLQELVEADPTIPEWKKGIGEIGAMVPELALSMALTPVAANAIRALRIPNLASAGLSARTAGVAEMEAARFAAPTAFGGTFGGLSYMTDQDLGHAMTAGFVGAIIPGLHQAATAASARLLSRILTKYPNLPKPLVAKFALAEELSGLAGVVVALEGQHIPDIIKAELPEGSDLALAVADGTMTEDEARDKQRARMLERMMGRIAALAAGGVVMGKNRKPRSLTIAEQNRMKASFEEVAKNPELMDGILDALKDHIGIKGKSHEAGLEVLEKAKARMEELKTPEAEAAKTDVVERTEAARAEADAKAAKAEALQAALKKGRETEAELEAAMEAEAPKPTEGEGFLDKLRRESREETAALMRAAEERAKTPDKTQGWRMAAQQAHELSGGEFAGKPEALKYGETAPEHLIGRAAGGYRIKEPVVRWPGLKNLIYQFLPDGVVPSDIKVDMVRQGQEAPAGKAFNIDGKAVVEFIPVKSSGAPESAHTVIINSIVSLEKGGAISVLKKIGKAADATDVTLIGTASAFKNLKTGGKGLTDVQLERLYSKLGATVDANGNVTRLPKTSDAPKPTLPKWSKDPANPMFGYKAKAPKPAEVKPPWEMTEAEFAAAEAKGMGVTWLNAWKTKDGRILTSASREHGDMVDPATGELVVGERGWTWKGLPKEDTFIGTTDVGKAGGDFWLAYKARAPKPAEGEGEPVVGKDWSDTHELTGEKQVLGKTPYADMVETGAVKELGDGSYEWGGKRYIKELDEGGLFWRTTEIVPKSKPVEVRPEDVLKAEEAEGAKVVEAVEGEAKIQEALEAVKQPEGEPPPPEPPKPPEGARHQLPPRPDPEKPLGAFAGDKLTRAFADRVIAKIRKEGDTARADRYEEHRDIMYKELHVTEAAKFMRMMDDAGFAELHNTKSNLPEWETAIDIEAGRRAEAKADAEADPAEKAKLYEQADMIYESVGEKLTVYGQSIQQATLLGMTSRGVIKMINTHLKKQGANELTPEQVGIVREHAGKVNKQKITMETAKARFESGRTPDNAGKWLEQIQELQFEMDAMSNYLYRFAPRTWNDILVTQIQGNLLTPGSLVLNMGANLLIRPVRAGARGVQGILDPASDLLYSWAFEGKKPKEAWKEIRLRNPIKGLSRSLAGFTKGAGVHDTAAAVAGWLMDIPESYMWKPDWKGTPNAMQVFLRGAVKNPYEVEGINMAPANFRMAAQQFMRLYRGDAIKHPGMAKQLNEFAKAGFETVLGIAPDVFFRMLYAGDVPFRKAAEYRIIGELAEAELAGRKDLTPKERKELVQMAIDNPHTLFDNRRVEWIKELAAAEVYQQRNFATELTGKAMGKLRRDSPLFHLGARIILPYQRTPINVTAEILSYIPFGGMANIAYNLKKLERLKKLQGDESFVDKRIKGWTEESRRDLTSAISKFAVGQAIGGMGNELAAYGLIQPTLDPSQGEPYKVKAFLESTFPSGHINITGLKRWAPLWIKAQLAIRNGESREKINALKEQALEAARWVPSDTTGSLIRTGSLGAIIQANVDAHKVWTQGKDADMGKVEELVSDVQREFSSVVNFMSTQPYTQTISELAKWASKSDGHDMAAFVSKLTETATAVGIPRTFSWFDMIKEKNRPTYRGGKFDEQILNKWQARLDSIGVDWKVGEHRKDLPVMLNHRGEARLRTPEGSLYVLGQKTSSTLWHIFGMGKVRKTAAKGDIPMRSAVESELMRLMYTRKDDRGGPDASVIGSMPRPNLQETITDRNGEKRTVYYELDPKQYENYQRLVGKLRYKGHKADPMLGLDDWVGGNRAREGGPRYWDLGAGDKRIGDNLRAESIRHRLAHFKTLAKKLYIDKNRKLLKQRPTKRGNVIYD